MIRYKVHASHFRVGAVFQIEGQTCRWLITEVKGNSLRGTSNVSPFIDARDTVENLNSLREAGRLKIFKEKRIDKN